jgi:hypothetical protein
LKCGSRQPVDKMDNSKESIQPIFIGQLGVSQESQTGFQNMSEFPFSKSILLGSVGTRFSVENAIFGEK